MEVEEYRRHSMDRWDALRTNTSLAAELLETDDNTGKLLAGYEANLFTVPDNPVIDPKALQDVRMVMSSGSICQLFAILFLLAPSCHQ